MSSRILFAIVLACDLIAQTPPNVDLERQLWTVVKQALNSPEGDEYFQSNMLDAQLPRLKGTLVSIAPSDSGITLMLGLADPSIPDVALLVHGANAKSTSELAPGAQIEFSAVSRAFTRDPFLVTFDTDKDSIVTKPFGAVAPFWYVGAPIGIVRNGRYQSQGTRVEFDLPRGWTVERARPSIDNSELVILSHSGFVGAYGAVWITHDKSDADEISMRLPAAVAEPSAPGGTMAESRTWITTGKTRALFLGRSPTSDLAQFQISFDQIISSAVVP